MLTKNAAGNLINKYKAVLANCRLMNVFGTLALATVLGLPSAALAEITSTIGVNQTTPWVSSDNINVSPPSGDATGIKATGTTNDITLQSAHTIKATAGDTDAYGMYGDSATDNNIFTNSGTMSITAESYGGAYGMSVAVTDSNATNTFTNSGAMTITSNGSAHGMHKYSNNSTNTFSNSGTMAVTGEGSGTAYGMDGYGYDSTNTFINSRIMTVTGEGSGDAYGMSVTGSDSTNNFTNSGTMTVTGNGNAYGMWEESVRCNNTFTNSGTMAVTGNGDGDVYGMYGDGNNNTNSFTNYDTMTITGEGNGNVYGMYGFGNTNNFTNSGIMTVAGNGNVYGMHESGNNTCTFTNSGTMTVTAENDAYGIRGAGATNTFSNSGTMTVTAGGSGTAYGMWVSGETSTLNSTGVINVSGGTAYQVYVLSGSVNIGTWTLKLGESYGEKGTGYHVFGVGYGTLNFGVGGKGATFIITNDTADGTLYAVKDLMDIGDAIPAKVEGYIAEAKSKYAFIQWDIVDENGKDYSSDSPLWSDQYLKGEVIATAGNSPAQAVANQAMGGMKSNMVQMRSIIANQTRGVGAGLRSGAGAGAGGSGSDETYGVIGSATMYADAGTTVSDAGTTSYIAPNAPAWEVFAMPYYSQNGANNGSYDGHMYGIAMGATCQITDDFALGAHAGFSKGSGDSALADTDATSYTLGAHAVYNVGESLFFRGQLSGFMAENDLDMLGSSAKLTRASTDMDTTGLYAMLGAGYDIALNANHILTPELGLSYFYAHMDGFDADFYDTTTGSKDASLGMASESYDVWYADATLRWTGIFDMGKGALKPTLKAGIRQALSDPDVSSAMEFGTVSATTHSDANDTSFLCEAGLAWEYDALTLSATYSGEFGNIEYSHMGTLKAEWKF